MRSDRQIEPVVVVPLDAYERLCDADAVVDELTRLTLTSVDYNAIETVAVAFTKAYDPSRADEIGHVAWALQKALKMALRVAAQEARQ